MNKNTEIIEVLDLFKKINNELIFLLNSLSEEDWNKETCLQNRSVKDLVTHIIDTSLRRLAMGRDNYFGEKPTDFSHEGMINFIQDLNKKWIIATKRLSPKILISLLEYSNSELVDYLETLNLYDKALFSVDWAGESLSLNWFDIAREYTEKWHHQMQIIEALGVKSKLYEKKYFKPVISTFVQGIPYTFNKFNKENFYLTIEILGESGGIFYIGKNNNKTTFLENIETENKITITQDEFWKLVTNSKDKNKISYFVQGDQSLGNHIITLVSVMSKI